MISDTEKVRWGQMIARTWSDDVYKARVFENPREMLRDMGVDLPDDVTVKVVEQSAESTGRGQLGVFEQQGDEWILTLPRPPADDADTELEDEQLEAVAGGFCCCCCWSGWTPP